MAAFSPASLNIFCSQAAIALPLFCRLSPRERLYNHQAELETVEHRKVRPGASKGTQQLCSVPNERHSGDVPPISGLQGGGTARACSTSCRSPHLSISFSSIGTHPLYTSSSAFRASFGSRGSTRYLVLGRTEEGRCRSDSARQGPCYPEGGPVPD